jgi:hypothetical protein
MLAREVTAAADEAARRQAQDLQQAARGWFVVEYAPYGREFIAYYQGECPPGGIMCRAAVADQLLMLMDRVAPPDWRTQNLPLVPARLITRSNPATTPRHNELPRNTVFP